MTGTRAAFLACLVAVGALVFAGTAGAHSLTKERAHKASLRGAEKHCENDGPECDSFGADNCQRPPGSGHRRRHKVDCDVFLSGIDGEGAWTCRWVDRWSISNQSDRLRWSQRRYDETFECTRP